MTANKNVFWGLLGLFVVIVLSGIGLVYFSFAAYFNPDRGKLLNMNFSGDGMVDADPDIGFVASRNTHNIRDGYDYFTDRLGVRVNRPGEQTPDWVSLVTLGGSFSWGFGMQNEKTYTELVKTRLGISAANLSFPSYGTTTSFLRFDQHLQLKPKVILYGFIGLHIGRTLSPCAPSIFPTCLSVPYISFDGEGEPVLNPPAYVDMMILRDYWEDVLLTRDFGWKNIYWEAVTLKNKILFYFQQGNLREVQKREYDEASKTRSLRFLFQHLKDRAQKIGARVVVMNIPLCNVEKNPDKVEPVSPVLTGALKGMGFHLLDLTPLVRTHYESDQQDNLCLSPTDPHPNETYHHLMADALVKFFGDNGIDFQ